MTKAISSTLVTSGILIVSYFTLVNFFPGIAHKQFFAFLIFLAGLQILSAFAHQRLRTENDPEKFVMTFLVTTGVKFILSLFIILILIKKFPEQKRVLALSYCAQYILFLAVDSIALLKKIRERN